MQGIGEDKAMPLNPNRIGKPLLKEPRFVRPSQNRMDEMKLVNYNETYNKMFDDGLIQNYISNDKVLKTYKIIQKSNGFRLLTFIIKNDFDYLFSESSLWYQFQ